MSPKKTYLRRIGSAPYQFLKRVPLKILPGVKGRTIPISLPPSGEESPVLVSTKIGTFVKFSLRTRDQGVAKAREAVARSELHKLFNAVGRGPTTISQRQIVGLAGIVYRLFADTFGENPGKPEKWAAWKAFNRAAGEGRITSAPSVLPEPFDEMVAAKDRFGTELTTGINSLPRTETVEGLESRFGEITNWVLAHHDLEVDDQTRQALLVEVYKAAQDAGWRLKRNAEGDYSPDPKQERFPPFEKQPHLTLSELFERWKSEVKPAPSTVMTWRGVLNNLKAHLGHENVRIITDADVIRWKDALVANGLKSKTIKDSYLGCLRAIFNFAADNKLIPNNPAEKVKVAYRKNSEQGALPYNDEEVACLLRLAKQETNPARRWLPWLAALSGARIGELAQLWGEEIKIENGVHFMQIRAAPDGGSLKTPNSERQVPLHPALIKEGFLDFVKTKGKGPLFYRRSSGDPNKRHASKGISNHVGEWIREQGFRDPRKAPNHAFRHWWKSTAARVDVQDSLADAIQGHAGRSVASTYRHFDLKKLAEGVAAIPIPSEKTGAEIQADRREEPVIG
jgi:integrase